MYLHIDYYLSLIINKYNNNIAVKRECVCIFTWIMQLQ